MITRLERDENCGRARARVPQGIGRVSKRIVALDVGDVRIGVAVSDPTRTIAQPLETYRRMGYGPDSRYLKALCERYDTDEVLLGLPLNMDGSAGGQAGKTRAFGEILEKAGLRVHYCDERLTSVTADGRCWKATFGARNASSS